MRAYRTQPTTQVRFTRFSRRKRSASQCARSKPASVPASPSLDTQVNNSNAADDSRDELDRWIDDQQSKRMLMKALHLGGYDNEANKVRLCRTVVNHSESGTEVNTWSCNSRFCNRCQRRAIIKRTSQVAEAFEGLHRTHSPEKYRWSLITLTIDDLRIDGDYRDPAPKAKALRKELTRLFNQRFWKKQVRGCFYKVEAPYTSKSKAQKGRANLHCHLLVIADCRNQDLRDWLKANYRLASVVDVRKFHFHGEKSVFEVCKGISSYLAKQWSHLTVHQLSKLIHAFKNLRASGSTGVVKKALAAVKARQEQTEREVPAPPPKPEVENDLPEGRYDKGGVLVAAMNGSLIAAWVLRLISWEAVYGHSYRANTGVDPPPP